MNQILSIIICFGHFVGLRILLALDFSYHNYDQMIAYLTLVNSLYSEKSLLYYIGKTPENRRIPVLAISNIAPLNEEAMLKYKNIKLIANIHGDEAVGREMLLHFIDFMLVPTNQNNNVINTIFHETILHILPSLNPDGFERALNSSSHLWRGNALDVDLNRNFPDYFVANERRESPLQPETRAIINWIKTYNFVFSVSFHGGAVVVSYPYDNHYGGGQMNGVPNYSDDRDVYEHLAKIYANFVDRNLVNDRHCSLGEYLPTGIVNGAQWYPITGGMQDYNYFNGVFELTIELSCPKFPSPNELPVYWTGHKSALISMLQELRRGIKGKVLTSSGGIPVWNALVFIDSRKHFVLTNKYGFFWRILLPGQYNVTIDIPKITFTTFIVIVPITGFTEMEFIIDDTYIPPPIQNPELIYLTN